MYASKRIDVCPKVVAAGMGRVEVSGPAAALPLAATRQSLSPQERLNIILMVLGDQRIIQTCPPVLTQSHHFSQATYNVHCSADAG
jgi:hypothetical protein